MGLSVTYFVGPLTKLDVDRDAEDFWDEAYEKNWLVATDTNGIARSAPLENRAVYATSGRGTVYASSYSGYNTYREALCNLVLGVDPRTVWQNPEQYEGRPFYEQINFGDNAGTLGPEACTRLAEAYETHRALAEREWDAEDADFHLDAYARFARAFAHAAQTGGALDFR